MCTLSCYVRARTVYTSTRKIKVSTRATVRMILKIGVCVCLLVICLNNFEHVLLATTFQTLMPIRVRERDDTRDDVIVCVRMSLDRCLLITSFANSRRVALSL